MAIVQIGNTKLQVKSWDLGTQEHSKKNLIGQDTRAERSDQTDYKQNPRKTYLQEIRYKI